MIVHVMKDGKLTRYAGAVAVVVVTPRKQSEPGYLGMHAVSQSDSHSNTETAASIIAIEQSLDALKENLPEELVTLVEKIRRNMESEQSVTMWNKKGGRRL